MCLDAGALRCVGKAQTTSHAVSQPGQVSSRHGKPRSATDLNRDESILTVCMSAFLCCDARHRAQSRCYALERTCERTWRATQDADQAGTHRLCLCALYVDRTQTAICDSQTLKSVPLVRVMPVETLQTSRTRSWREEECQAYIPVEHFLVSTELPLGATQGAAHPQHSTKESVRCDNRSLSRAPREIGLDFNVSLPSLQMPMWTRFPSINSLFAGINPRSVDFTRSAGTKSPDSIFCHSSHRFAFDALDSVYQSSPPARIH